MKEFEQCLIMRGYKVLQDEREGIENPHPHGDEQEEP